MINCIIRSSRRWILAAQPRLLTHMGGTCGNRVSTTKCDLHNWNATRIKSDSHNKMQLAQIGATRTRPHSSLKALYKLVKTVYRTHIYDRSGYAAILGIDRLRNRQSV